MNKQQKLRKQYKTVIISSNKITGDKHNKRATNVPRRFPKFAGNTPWVFLAATNYTNFVSFSLERKMSLKFSELWLSKHTSIELQSTKTGYFSHSHKNTNTAFKFHQKWLIYIHDVANLIPELIGTVFGDFNARVRQVRHDRKVAPTSVYLVLPR